MGLGEFLAAALLLLGACSTAPGPRPVIDLGRLQVLDPAAFPGQDALVAGFDPSEPQAEWRLGDRVLFGLGVWRGTDVERRRTACLWQRIGEGQRVAQRSCRDRGRDGGPQRDLAFVLDRERGMWARRARAAEEGDAGEQA